MATQLKLPESPYTKAFRDFCRILETDPDLRACGVNFRFWCGEKGDDVGPALNQTPFLRCTPIEASSSLGGEGFHEIRLPIEIDVAVSGTNIDEYFNLIYAVTQAIFPSDTERRNEVDRMKTQGSYAFQCELVRPGFNVSSSESLLAGNMQFDLKIHLFTRG